MKAPRTEAYYVWRVLRDVEGEDRLLVPNLDDDMNWDLYFDSPEEARQMLYDWFDREYFVGNDEEWAKENDLEDWVLCSMVLAPVVPYPQRVWEDAPPEEPEEESEPEITMTLEEIDAEIEDCWQAVETFRSGPMQQAAKAKAVKLRKMRERLLAESVE